ncbi:MAG: hypothetical protein JJU45_18960 [Acidimicrobiia bacterium]|nr:hypothetical protein [Acidimicrobiia bacterium]
MSNSRRFRRKVAEQAQADQVATAARILSTNLEQMAAETGCNREENSHRLAASRLHGRLLGGPAAEGRLKACPHMAAPQPGAVLAPFPGVVWCASCAAEILARDEFHELWTTSGCDLCADQVGRYHPVVIQDGPVAIHATVCPSCFHDTPNPNHN